MSDDLAPPPLHTPMVDRLRQVTKVWENYYRSRDTRIQAGSALLQAVDLTDSPASASIPATPFSLGTVAAGLYRVSYHAKITTAATTSSSLLVTVTYTRGGFTCNQSGAAIIDNTTSTVGSGTFLLRADGSTAISYSTTYVSVGATPMAYELDMVIQQGD